MYYNIFITGDQNDANYVTKTSVITSEGLEFIKPLIEAINNFKPYEGDHPFTHHHNFPFGEHLPREDLGEKSPEEIYSHIDPDIIDFFYDLVPLNIHTITLIEVSPYQETEVLLEK